MKQRRAVEKEAKSLVGQDTLTAAVTRQAISLLLEDKTLSRRTLSLEANQAWVWLHVMEHLEPLVASGCITRSPVSTSNAKLTHIFYMPYLNPTTWASHEKQAAAQESPALLV